MTEGESNGTQQVHSYDKMKKSSSSRKKHSLIWNKRLRCETILLAHIDTINRGNPCLLLNKYDNLSKINRFLS